MLFIALIIAALYATPGLTLTLGTHTHRTYQGDSTEVEFIQTMKVWSGKSMEEVAFRNTTMEATIDRKEVSQSDIQTITKMAEDKMKSSKISSSLGGHQTKDEINDLPMQRCVHDVIVARDKVPRKKEEMIFVKVDDCLYSKNKTMAGLLLSI